MMGWFRFYNEALNDPKVQCLSGDLFKTWVNVLCLASKHAGVLPANSEIAYCLRMAPEAIDDALARLAQAVLLEQDENGRWRPHNWDTRQRKSDRSTERVQKHRKNRKRYGNGRVTARETRQIDREREEEISPSKISSSLSQIDRPPSARSRAPLADGSRARSPHGGDAYPTDLTPTEKQAIDRSPEYWTPDRIRERRKAIEDAQ